MSFRGLFARGAIIPSDVGGKKSQHRRGVFCDVTALRYRTCSFDTESTLLPVIQHEDRVRWHRKSGVSSIRFCTTINSTLRTVPADATHHSSRLVQPDVLPRMKSHDGVTFCMTIGVFVYPSESRCSASVVFAATFFFFFFCRVLLGGSRNSNTIMLCCTYCLDKKKVVGAEKHPQLR